MTTRQEPERPRAMNGAIEASMQQIPASPPYAALASQHACTPHRPPDDLLAALGTGREAMRYPPAVLWWERLDRLPPSAHHHNPGPAPVLAARRDGRSLVVWCRYCRKHHRHGAHSSLCSPAECACPIHTDRWARFCLCPDQAGSGHRGAHCTNPKSPYRLTGYIVMEVAR
jgi:hypothetical protein